MEKNAKVSIGALGSLFVNFQPDIETNEEEVLLPIMPQKPKLKERRFADDIDTGEQPLLPTGIKEKDPPQNK